MKRPEYTGIVTGVYARALREHRKPTAEEMELLEQAFSREGFTQGYFDGDKQDMFGTRLATERTDESVFARARKEYGEGEVRRVPVHFYTVVEKGVPARAIAFDDEGHRAMTYGPVPERAKRQGLTREYLTEQMYKTGGTPYNCVENQAKTDPGLYLPAAAINELRRRLINQLSENRAAPPPRRVLTVPPMPKNLTQPAEPKIIFQVRTAEQLTRELAELKPDYLYIPALEIAAEPERLLPLAEYGVTPVAVLPRIITDTEIEPVRTALEKLFDAGVNEALVGNLGHIFLAAGVEYVIIGHSERRDIFGENDILINAKVKKAFAAGLKPILCCGESLALRKAGTYKEWISRQIKWDLSGITAEQVKNLVIAYEPIWAIGTGETATAEQAEEVCKLIREYIAELYDGATAEAVRIQYGGSMNAGNAAELLAMPDIDGGLIGGASLKADFGKIVNYNK